MKVYIVTEGSYSDYRIVAVLSDRTEAEALASSLYDGEVASWIIDDTY